MSQKRGRKRKQESDIVEAEILKYKNEIVLPNEQGIYKIF